MRLSNYITTTCVLARAALVQAAPSLDLPLVERFTHESVPGYTLDVLDPSSLGIDPQVKQQAGYLGTPSGDQLFYWYFESQSAPGTDPVLIWLNGGPGCSSLEAILFENGPSTINRQMELSPNPWSWNKHSNLLYIDSPAGVGYSYGGRISTSTAAAVDFKNAVKLFWQRNQQTLAQSKLHISGESYAGRYIPVFAEAINTDPQAIVKVSSVLIGNGLVSPVAEYESYQPMLCGQGGFSSVLSSQECSEMAAQTNTCLNVARPCENGDAAACSDVGTACSRLQRYFSGRNPYDIRDAQCTPTYTQTCYSGMDTVQEYFNEARVKQAVGVNTRLEYDVCSSSVESAFYGSGDPYQPTFHNVTNLLESGTPVLVYNGDADIILNWLGGRQWTSGLQWSGQQGFQAAGKQPQDWVPSGSQVRGQVTNYEQFTFLRVHGAGHMVPHDQPESAYYFVDQWLRGDYALKQKV